MATSGPALWPGTSTFPDTTVYPGQGDLPIYRAFYSTDDASVSNPTWTDATPDLRGGQTARGRENELSDFDTGEASLTLNNRSRTYEPNSNALIRPMNRWWVYEEWSGERKDLFRGYAESYTQSWQDPSMVDATTTVQASDHFKVLALDNLPTTSPVRGGYDEVIASDIPAGYWRLNELPAAFVQTPEVIEPNPIEPRPPVGPLSPAPALRRRLIGR